MLYQRLREYAERVRDQLPVTGYIYQSVRWVIALDENGTCLGVIDRATTTARGKGSRGANMMVPNLRRSSEIAPKLLADNGEYVLGIPRKDKTGKPRNPERVRRQHEAFVQLVRECHTKTGEKSLSAVLAFLEGLPASIEGHLPDDFDPSQNLTFDVEGCYPIDLPSVRTFWAEKLQAEDSSRTMTCFVCGQEKQVVRTLPVAIQGIPGETTTGLTLISANCSAFESYGLSQSYICPICYECAELTHHALNYLLASENATVRVDDVVYVAWTQKETDFDPLALLQHPERPENARAVRELIRAPLTGKTTHLDIDHSGFYTVALSGNQARVVVREWIDTTLGVAKENIGRFFRKQRLAVRTGDETFYGVFTLARTTVREGANPPRNLVIHLIRSALKGDPLPEYALHQAIRRNRLERKITHPRMVLIKMLLAQHLGLEDDLVKLDVTRPEPAYHCGRLMAVLESLQYHAVGPVNSTIIDRYYSGASAAPALVFPTLNKLAQAHLCKLRRAPNKQGIYRVLKHKLTEIQSMIHEYPERLSIIEQGLFDLGYWHQSAADVAAVQEARNQVRVS